MFAWLFCSARDVEGSRVLFSSTFLARCLFAFLACERAVTAGGGPGSGAFRAGGLYQASRPRPVLVLGGTGFVGGTAVRLLIKSGEFDVTVVTRGNWPWDSKALIQPHVRHVVCDRTFAFGLSECPALTLILRNTTFEAVLDFNTFSGEQMLDSVSVVKNRVSGFYLYVSSDSVYDVCDRRHLGPTRESDAVRPKVDDVAKVILDILFSNSSVYDQAYNLAFKEAFTLNSFLTSVAKELGVSDVKFDQRNAGVHFYPESRAGILDTAKAEAMLGWKPTPWEKALHRNCVFYEYVMTQRTFKTCELKHLVKTFASDVDSLLLLLYHCAPVLYYLCTGILLGSVGYCLVLYLAPKSRVNGNGKAVFITGCDSGFGFGLAKRLDSLGFTVFAGCLLADSGGEGSKKLRAECSSRLSTVQIDVTDDGQVKAAVQQVKDRLPTGPLRTGEQCWSLAAGRDRVGQPRRLPTCDGSEHFGTVRVTKAFLPLIRREKGRVVNISSVGGLHAGPMAGAYSMTKAALEFFSDALRHEMHKWGVKVVIVEPASFARATDIVLPAVFNNFVENLRNNLEDVVMEDYGEEYFDFKMEQLRSYAHGDLAATDPTPVIDVMADAVTLTTPTHRYLVGASFEDYVTWMWLGYFPSKWTGATLLLEGGPTPAMLQKTN
ncbi:hypothetical protein Bbelb_103060 [Branchiostoma belcheri]|nr:hypothetical protein Bbelb_103060 [Branchiostoma belcheri]